MDGRREIRLHLGAHKTASTHFQRSLLRHRDALAQVGIDFVPARELREAIRQQPHWVRLPGGRGRALRAALAGLGRGAPVLALSEENLLGNVEDALAAEPYARLHVRSGLMAQAIGAAPVGLCLAIRGFDRFWPSCAVEMLRTGGTPPPFAAFAGRPPSWVEVIARLRRVWPRAPLTVWRLEDYDARRMATAFLGRDPGPLPGVVRRSRRESPSAEGVRLALAAAGDARRVAEIFARHPAQAGEPFQPFDAATVSRLREAYARDLATLASDPTIRLLQPVELPPAG